jgi:c-di-GMP-binding flagellar brake protein YcgR
VLVGASAWVLVDDQRFSAECVDLSMGGAALRTDAVLHTGGVVTFELSLGLDHGSIAIACEVVRVAKAQVGLRFLALDRRSLEAILALL